MKNLIFLNSCPHDPYFQWQEEVCITNFRKFGLSDKMVVIVWYPKGSTQLDRWRVLQKKYPEVRFHLYEDEGVDLGLYISQLRPHSIKKYFKEFKYELKDKVFFYHDSDIIFNYLPDFEKLIQGDILWQSNTTGYLDYDYLRRKEDQGKLPKHLAVKTMATIGGIPVETIQEYNGKTGGAQYILKNIDSDFWQDIETQVLKIRRAFFYGVEGSINKRYFPSEEEGFQSWCADMWAINFALWKRGFKTDVTPELEFSWATDSLETFNKKPIYHNAGATKGGEIFYKGDWIYRSPICEKIPMPPETSASRQYVLAINEVCNKKEQSPS